MGRMKYFKDCDVVVTEKEGLETKPLPYPSRTGEKLSPEEIEELVEKYIQDQDVIADFVVETDVYEKFQKGLEMYLTENNSIVNRNGTDVTLDVTMIDEVSADMIIQYALFGEIVYG